MRMFCVGYLTATCMEYDLVKSTEFGEALHVEIKWRESPLTNLGLIQEKFLLETLRLF